MFYRFCKIKIVYSVQTDFCSPPTVKITPFIKVMKVHFRDIVPIEYLTLQVKTSLEIILLLKARKRHYLSEYQQTLETMYRGCLFI